jgi:hypothetical protein
MLDLLPGRTRLLSYGSAIEIGLLQVGMSGHHFKGTLKAPEPLV